MKGLELPINMIVVVAIAVLVLVVVAAFFVGRVSPADIDLERAFGTGCNTLRALYNCVVDDIRQINVPGYLPPGAVSADYPDGFPFDEVCRAKGLVPADCAKACGCPA